MLKYLDNWLFGVYSPISSRLPFFVRSCGESAFPDDKCAIPSKTGFFVELFWGIEGGCDIVYPDGVHTFHSGDVCFYNYGSTHILRPHASGVHFRWITIEGPLAEAFFEHFRVSRTPRHIGSCPEELFCGVMRTMRSPEPEMTLASFATAVKIISLAIIPSAAPAECKPCAAELARKLIDNTFMNSDINVNALAEQLLIHRVSLSRVFKERFGIAISGYLNRKRLERAVHLLETTELPQRTVAAQCGFSDIAYFSRFIRRMTGRTPGAFRADGGSGRGRNSE